MGMTAPQAYRDRCPGGSYNFQLFPMWGIEVQHIRNKVFSGVLLSVCLLLALPHLCPLPRLLAVLVLAVVGPANGNARQLYVRRLLSNLIGICFHLAGLRK